MEVGFSGEFEECKHTLPRTPPWPRSQAHFPFLDIPLSTGEEVCDRVYQAVARLIERFGGYGDTGGQVPAMMKVVGFADIESSEISRSDSPRAALLRWIQRGSENHDNLVEQGLQQAEDLRDCR